MVSRMTPANTDTPVFELVLDADAENLLIARQAIDGLAASLDLSVAQRDDIKLAVTEACTNVVKYAYADGSGRMRLNAEAGSSNLTVTVSDNGSWKEPGTPGAPDEPGHGLSVIEAICAELSIDSSGDGTTLVMIFDREGSSETA